MIYNRDALLTKAPIKNMLTGKMQEHGVSHGLGEAGYDIRIKQEIVFSGPHGTIWVRDGENSFIHNGRFVLASAMEEFDMPTDLVGIVHDKSTWARQGLSVFNTVIESGWKGHLTLELVYHGADTLCIPAGAGIAQVVFHHTACKAAYDGKYQNQEDKPVAAILV